MKKKMENRLPEYMEELSPDACALVRGGETAWYWVGYVLGSLLHGLTSGAPNSGQRLYNMALG